MKSPLLLAILLLVVSMPIRSASLAATTAESDVQMIVDVAAADSERRTAMMTGDRARLDAILCDELRYAHNRGHVDSKKSLIDTLISRKIVYENFEYLQRDFLPAAPGVVLMTGRVLIHAINENEKIVVDLNFLSVWRKENGHWCFLSWQSCANHPAPSTPK